MAEQTKAERKDRPEVAVVVLGDIARSPRISYQAHSIASELDYDVKLFGYLDTSPSEMLVKDPRIEIVPILPPPDCLAKLPESLQMFFKFIWTFVVLFHALFFKTSWLHLHSILMQNPPAIPTMISCFLVCRIKKARFCIDWHNYMYSVLKDKYKIAHLDLPRVEDTVASEQREGQSGSKRASADSRVVRRRRVVGTGQNTAIVAEMVEKPVRKEKWCAKRWYTMLIYKLEGYFGRLADSNYCVTRAMRDDLRAAWGIEANTFYDRPPAFRFRKVTDLEKHRLFQKLAAFENGKVFRDKNGDANSTAFTICSANEDAVQWRSDRPLLIVSSTSWTADEDFEILLQAVNTYDEHARIARSDDPDMRIPELVLVITGKGPMKEYYLERIKKLQLYKVNVMTPWLEAADYPIILAAADIGVSLHTSTSGLDLPMKVVDMFGAGIPVLAKRFACIEELVQEDVNGLLFDTSTELTHILKELAIGFPVSCSQLDRLQKNVDPATSNFGDWEQNWNAVVRPDFAKPHNQHFHRVIASEPEKEE
ncbi:hypothetical protein WR25_04580 [Diploscapter pachys]|uniref:Glycosyl transferase family 1 domain-containing protein n=1 Tax=Diploscapter pachys TaxID=2018661 RepID=A0A2A2LKN7_9BILA|nr:hypothetical protein WR25_04580 [Diploscapter pachys]